MDGISITNYRDGNDTVVIFKNMQISDEMLANAFLKSLGASITSAPDAAVEPNPPEVEKVERKDRKPAARQRKSSAKEEPTPAEVVTSQTEDMISTTNEVMPTAEETVEQSAPAEGIQPNGKENSAPAEDVMPEVEEVAPTAEETPTTDSVEEMQIPEELAPITEEMLANMQQAANSAAEAESQSVEQAFGAGSLYFESEPGKGSSAEDVVEEPEPVVEAESAKVVTLPDWTMFTGMTPADVFAKYEGGSNSQKNAVFQELLKIMYDQRCDSETAEGIRLECAKWLGQQFIQADPAGYAQKLSDAQIKSFLMRYGAVLTAEVRNKFITGACKKSWDEYVVSPQARDGVAFTVNYFKSCVNA